jgi:hypothetical protein
MYTRVFLWDVYVKLKPMKKRSTTTTVVQKLKKDLRKLDYTALDAGDTLIVWVQEIESDGAIVDLPMLKIEVPTATKKARSGARSGGASKVEIVKLIVQKLTAPLSRGVPEDVFVFYQLLAVLAQTEAGDIQDDRWSLIDAFENGGGVAALDMLHVGKSLANVHSIRPYENGEVGVYELVWRG